MLTLDLIPFEDKEVMPFRKSLDLFGILDGASHNVSYSEFINFRGKGFVLENEDIWLSYLKRKNIDNDVIQLIFHKLPNLIAHPLFRAEIWGIDMIRDYPFSIEFSGDLKAKKETICKALYVHKGDSLGTRVDYNDYCCVGRTVQAFCDAHNSNLENTIKNPNPRWFEEGSELLAVAAEKYNLAERIRNFNSSASL